VLSTDPPNLHGLERRTVRAALEQAHGNKVQAAKLLGISRRAIIVSLQNISWRKV